MAHHIRRNHSPEATKTPAMKTRTPMFSDAFQVFSCPISLVVFPVPQRAGINQVNHQGIPMHLGNIGRGRNAEKAIVSLDRRQNRFITLTQVHGVDDNGVTRPVQGPNCCPHCLPGGFENIDPVDNLRPDFHDHPCIRVLPNPKRRQVAPFHREPFRITNTVVVRDL